MESCQIRHVQHIFLARVHTACFASLVAVFIWKLLFIYLQYRMLQKRTKVYLCHCMGHPFQASGQSNASWFLLEDKNLRKQQIQSVN